MILKKFFVHHQGNFISYFYFYFVSRTWVIFLLSISTNTFVPRKKKKKEEQLETIISNHRQTWYLILNLWHLSLLRLQKNLTNPRIIKSPSNSKSSNSKYALAIESVIIPEERREKNWWWCERSIRTRDRINLTPNGRKWSAF